MLKNHDLGSSMVKSIALSALLGAAALAANGCTNPDPNCASGTGTLSFVNDADEPVVISIKDESGDLPDLTLAAHATNDDVTPTGGYTISVKGATSGRSLLTQSYGVRCDVSTTVQIEPPVQLAIGTAAARRSAAETLIVVHQKSFQNGVCLLNGLGSRQS